MPKRMIRGCEYFVEEHGTGQETIVFIHGLFMSGRAWHNQVLAMRSRYRCVEYDLRGHGRSGSPSGGYDMEDLADDLIQLIQTARYEPCHLVGGAMGATVAMHIATKRPELVKSLTLLAATSDAEEAQRKRQMQLLALGIRLLGMRPFASRMMQKVFGQHFLRDEDRRIQVEHWRTEFKKRDAKGLSQAVRAYARRKDLSADVGRIRAPTLILAGERDEICPPSESQMLNQAISGSRYVTSPKAAHCPAIETPEEVSEALNGFLSSLQKRRR